jgi:tetratricopeptide (TPR) repeat protein
MSRRMWPVVALVCLVVRLAGAAPAAGDADFLPGLDAMEAGQWPQAAESFGKAVATDDEAGNYRLMRGVALLLAGDAKTAQTELTRAYRLNPKDVLTKRWTAGVYRFNGDPMGASKICSPSDYRGPQEACEQYSQKLRFSAQDKKGIAAAREYLEREAKSLAATFKKDQPGLVVATYDRAKQAIRDGKPAEAMHDLEAILSKDPLNDDVLSWHAKALVQLGRFSSARVELTHLLANHTNGAEFYALRSVCEAKLGNVARAKSDWAAANQYGADVAKQYEVAFNATIGGERDRANEPIGAAAKAFNDAIERGDPIDKLVEAATELAKTHNAHRKLWDETYQDQRRTLDDAARASPQSVDALMALGTFFYREADMPGEQLGPGGAYRAFRFGGSAQRIRDLRDALAIFDRVLALDPKNALAITWKAAIQLEYGSWEEGKKLVEQALAIRSDIPELLELLARILDNAARVNNYEATNLRTTKSWTEFGIDYDVLWTRYPSQAELQRAAALQAEAERMWAAAEANLRAAIEARRGTADGFYFDGLLKRHAGDGDGAIASFAKAAEMDKSSRRNRVAWITALGKAGRTDEAGAAQAAFMQERQTTATASIAQAWADIDRTAFKSARVNLTKATEIDPTDERCVAYLAVIATADEKHEQAAKFYLGSLAQEEARLRLDGKTLSPDSKDTISCEDAGMAMLFNLRRAARFELMGKKDDQLASLQFNVALARRIGDAALRAGGKLDRAVLPNTTDVKAWAPKTAWNMAAWSHALAGHVLVQLGRADEALPLFAQIADGPETPDVYDPQCLCLAGQLRLEMAKRDRRQSRMWMTNAATLTRVSQEEAEAITGGLPPVGDNPEAFMRAQSLQMRLRFFGAQDVIEGGYDYRQNPNYKGSFDPGPDDVAREGIH